MLTRELVNHRIDRVTEKVGKLLQALIVAKRYGWFNCSPDRPVSNSMDVVLEGMDDVQEAMEKLHIELMILKKQKYGEKANEN